MSLEAVCQHWGIKLNGQRSPIDVPGVGRDRDLPELFKVLGFTRGAEIGVEQGVYAEQLCRQIPNLQLYAVDCWTAHRGYRDHVSQSKLDGFHLKAIERLMPYRAQVIKEWSVAAARAFDDRSLDFVYIDANHDFANVVMDLHAWTPKVRKGGIIAGHDFKRRKNPIAHHVVEAVTGWAACYKVAPWFVLGRRERVPGETRDDSRSWMWINA